MSVEDRYYTFYYNLDDLHCCYYRYYFNILISESSLSPPL